MAEIRQTDSVRLMWDDMNNRAETIFKFILENSIGNQLTFHD